MMALRWKKRPKPTGLASIGAGPRGSELTDGEKVYAWISPSGGGSRGPVEGWYWVSPIDATGAYMNTCDALVADEAAAKAAAMAWVKARLAAQVSDGAAR